MKPMAEELAPQGPVFLIETDKIVPNPFQPRRVFNEDELRDLANSIREVGLLQPIVVSKIEKETEMGTEVSYELIAGERRLMATKMLGLERIPAIIKAVTHDRERLELAIVENVQRANLNPIEAARAYAQLQDQFRLTQREVAVRLGKSREAIANTVRLLNLPTEIQDAIVKNLISESQGRVLLSLDDPAEQMKFFHETVRNNLSVRELRGQIERHRMAGREQQSLLAANPELQSLEKELEEALGTKVKVEKAGETGKITIQFFSPEELRGLIEKLVVKKALAGEEQLPPITF